MPIPARPQSITATLPAGIFREYDIRGIADKGITVLMTEHVMQAVMSLAGHVFVLAEGRVIAQGTPQQVAGDQRVVEAYLGHGAAKRMTTGVGHG